MRSIQIVLSAISLTSVIFLYLAEINISDVTNSKNLTLTPTQVGANVTPALREGGLRIDVFDVADIDLRGAAEASAADVALVTGAIGGLLRPATTDSRVEPQSLAIAELCRADLRAAACSSDNGHRRARNRLTAMLTRNQGLSAVTRSEEIGAPVRSDKAGACVEGRPCAVAVVDKGATVVSVTYRPEDTVPEDLTASLTPVRMVGGMMIKAYR